YFIKSFHKIFIKLQQYVLLIQRPPTCYNTFLIRPFLKANLLVTTILFAKFQNEALMIALLKL
ncbi:MAG: hypothetical protein RBS48_12040, partial [Ignavibacteriaceae bacterium]|nr:hypothetical protein [Ignavibacteriaceae bacterium]